MVEIELSVIPDTPEDTTALTKLLDEFTKQNQVSVRVYNMNWEEAWNVLLATATHGAGPDVSQVGSTWLGNLVKLNALRPFGFSDLAVMSSEKASIQPAWQSGIIEGDRRFWSMPWTSYFYTICYRRDLLEKLGRDEDIAFLNADLFVETISALQKVDIQYPWLMANIPQPYTDLLHLAASWIWGAGGDFLSFDGKRAVFGMSQASTGIKVFLEAYRRVSDAGLAVDFGDFSSQFLQGNVAAAIMDVREARATLENASPEFRANIGTHAISSVPWFGSSNLVIWKHVQQDPERERAALALVRFMTSRGSQIEYCHATTAVPARIDAIGELFPSRHPLSNAITQTIHNGKQYRTIAAWPFVEFQFANCLGEMVREARANPDLDAGKIVSDYIFPLVEQFNAELGRR